jgi:hypothetical protein
MLFKRIEQIGGKDPDQLNTLLLYTCQTRHEELLGTKTDVQHPVELQRDSLSVHVDELKYALRSSRAEQTGRCEQTLHSINEDILRCRRFDLL